MSIITSSSAVLLLCLFLSSPAYSQSAIPQIHTFESYLQSYQKAQQQLASILPAHTLNKGDRIRLISELFINTPYIPNQLVGGRHTQERLIVDFGKLDCFTYLDYIEALRKSRSQSEFLAELVDTRYINGELSYLSRRHFFSDWVSEPKANARDITETVSINTVSTNKHLNQTKTGGTYIPGLPVKPRQIKYIPSENIDTHVVSQLKDGDYIGIYTEIEGLDVTHTGVFIRTENGPVLRHASSKPTKMKVIDSPFFDYVKKTPGIVIYRAI